MSTPIRKIRFGAVSELVLDRDRWLDHVRTMEDSGIDTLLVRDHVATEPFGPQFAPFSMLATAAACTTRLRVGTLVLGNDYRHPAVVAHEAATLDWLSGGRFQLGLGAGWYRAEYERAGIAFDPAGARIARLAEAVSIIKALLAGETVTLHGDHYTVTGLSLPVRPAQQPRPPLLIGGGGPKMLALAARHADILGILPAPIRGDDGDDPRDRAPAALEDKLGVVRAAAGSRFGELELSTFATFVITAHRRRDTEDLARSRGWQGMAAEDIWDMPSVFIGSVAQIANDLHARRARYGLTYYVTTDRAAGALAQIIRAG